MVYFHEQTASSSTWTITHNLDRSSVAVDVMVDDNGDLKKILPLSVVHSTNNTIIVNFSSAKTGKATVVA